MEQFLCWKLPGRPSRIPGRTCTIKSHMEILQFCMACVIYSAIFALNECQHECALRALTSVRRETDCCSVIDAVVLWSALTLLVWEPLVCSNHFNCLTLDILFGCLLHRRPPERHHLWPVLFGMSRNDPLWALENAVNKQYNVSDSKPALDIRTARLQ